MLLADDTSLGASRWPQTPVGTVGKGKVLLISQPGKTANSAGSAGASSPTARAA
jgi:hypothetical protein